MNLNFLYQHYVDLYCQKSNAIQETASIIKKNNRTTITEKQEELLYENFKTLTNKIVTSKIILNIRNDNESIENSKTYHVYKCCNFFSIKQLNYKESYMDIGFNKNEYLQKNPEKKKKNIYNLIKNSKYNHKFLLSKKFNRIYSKLINLPDIKSCKIKLNNNDYDDNYYHNYFKKQQINEKIQNSRNLFFLFNIYLLFIIVISLIKFVSILTWIKLVFISIVFLIYQKFGIFNANLICKATDYDFSQHYQNINITKKQKNRIQHELEDEITDYEYRKFFNFHLKLIYQPIKKHYFQYYIRLKKYKPKRKNQKSYCQYNKNLNSSFLSELSLLFFINYFYFCKFLKNNFNFYHFLVFIKNYFKLNCYTFVCFFIKIVSKSSFTMKKVKSLILIFSLFGSTFCESPNNYVFAQQINLNIYNNTLNTNSKDVINVKKDNSSYYSKSNINNINNNYFFKKIANIKLTTPKNKNNYYCDETSLNFDQRLFEELNMLETLNGVYNSCFKDDFDSIDRLDKLKEENRFYRVNFENIDDSKLLNLKCNRRKTIENILKSLLNSKKKILSNDLLEKFDSICNIRNKPNDNIGIEDKLFYLSSYKHNLCGNIFRNSVKKKNLKRYILNQNDFMKKQNQQTEFKEIKLHFEIENNQKFLKANQNSQLESDHINHRHHFNSPANSTDLGLPNENESEISIGADINDKPVFNFFRDVNLQFATEKKMINFNSTSNSSLKQSSSSSLSSSNLSADNSLSNDLKKNTEFLSNYTLNNCTLILLNSYLLAYKSDCENNEFIDGLNLYDCSSNNFSVKSDCQLCKVKLKLLPAIGLNVVMALIRNIKE